MLSLRNMDLSMEGIWKYESADVLFQEVLA